ncbi:MAG: YwqG family protein [Ktedonobacteraceae bacterium]
MDKAGVQATFVATGISRLAKDIDRLARPSIRLSASPVAESTLQMGASKLGGTPDLPTGVSWPELKGLPQSFIAQLRLADVHPYDINHQLPQSGMLWFFYDAQQQTYGADPADRGGWRVFYVQSEQPSLQRAAAPATLPAESRFQPCALSFVSEITLSQQPKLEIPDCDWTEDEQKKYEDLLATFPSAADHAAIHHRLLGNPDTIQDDMHLQCQLVSHGVTDTDDPRAAELSKGALEWQLLLQVDSDEHAGMQWGNTGMLYYWIQAADLQAPRFDTTWLVLQSE